MEVDLAYNTVILDKVYRADGGFALRPDLELSNRSLLLPVPIRVKLNFNLSWIVQKRELFFTLQWFPKY
jgi:hypothetical protein